MAVKLLSSAIVGFSAQPIEVEVEATHGLRSFCIVGLPDKSVQESCERVNAAIKNSAYSAPAATSKKVLVNLAPADLKKEGSSYDLPIALGYLLKTEQIKFDPLDKLIFGELSLNGDIKYVKGALAICLNAKDNKKITQIILPKDNALEGSLAFIGQKDAPKIIGVSTLKEAIKFLEGKISIPATIASTKNILAKKDNESEIDIGWIKGHDFAKRALQICAAGGHNLLMVGPPGGGKSLLAKSLPSIMPNPSLDEIIELTKIYSLAGMLNPDEPLFKQRPFRSPHHSASPAAIVGGGTANCPGEITLAHRGVLFLDEFPEFRRDVLEALRQPIEDGKITISRAKNRTTFPCRFMLVAAANPTPGGFYENQTNSFYSAAQVAKYKRKLSGPIIDRIDIHIDLPPVTYEKLIDESQTTQSSVIRKNIERARQTQMQRFAGEGIVLNSEMQIPHLKKFCALPNESHHMLKKLVDSGRLSARGYHRILKVARTIADLEMSENIKHEHINEALIYRVKQEI